MTVRITISLDGDMIIKQKDIKKISQLPWNHPISQILDSFRILDNEHIKRSLTNFKLSRTTSNASKKLSNIAKIYNNAIKNYESRMVEIDETPERIREIIREWIMKPEVKEFGMHEPINLGRYKGYGSFYSFYGCTLKKIYEKKTFQVGESTMKTFIVTVDKPNGSNSSAGKQEVDYTLSIALERMRVDEE